MDLVIHLERYFVLESTSKTGLVVRLKVIEQQKFLDLQRDDDDDDDEYLESFTSD